MPSESAQYGPDNPLLVQLGAAQPYLHEAGLLQWRENRHWYQFGIVRLGRGLHNHSGMLSWWDGDWMVLESIEGGGVHAVALETAVGLSPGLIDVYLPNPDARFPEFNAFGAAAYFRRMTGRPYGWRNILRAAARHALGIRMFVRPVTDDRSNGNRNYLPYCSQAVAVSCREGGGVDPVPGLPDWLTEPADLGRSALWEYGCTLLPDKPERVR